MRDLKKSVKEFWNEKSCGEVYAQGDSAKARLETQAAERYMLEPHIFDFARFPEGQDKNVLEIGVGMGADHLEWAKSRPRSLTGIDLTGRAVEFTRQRLDYYSLYSDLKVADAENLPFPNNFFDIVYSYGVLHHSPDTARAVDEVHRVLKPGGTARIMIYHSPSIVGYMLWLRYGLLAGRPFRSLREIYAQHLESPGTKAFSRAEAEAMFTNFSSADIRIVLGPGDLLEGAVGQRHRGPLLAIAKAIWPRWFVRRVLGHLGLGMTIAAIK